MVKVGCAATQFINLKQVGGMTFSDACKMLTKEISNMMSKQYSFLLDSPYLLAEDKEQCRFYLKGKERGTSLEIRFRPFLWKI